MSHRVVYTIPVNDQGEITVTQSPLLDFTFDPKTSRTILDPTGDRFKVVSEQFEIEFADGHAKTIHLL